MARGLMPKPSKSSAAVASSVAAAADVKPSHRAADYLTLTKPRLNFLVLITTLGGMYIAAPGAVPAAILLHGLVGTALVAGGAAVAEDVSETGGLELARGMRGLWLSAAG